MKRILLGALCAVTTLALLTGCVKTTDGTERCCTLTVSGEDGSLLLTDITAELN